MVCFFWLVCRLCSSAKDQKAQRDPVFIDGALDGEEDPLDGRLCLHADIAVARTAPFATEGDRKVFLFLLIGAAPGQLHPVQIGLASGRDSRGVENLIRERVHFERRRESAGDSKTLTFKFTFIRKKVFSFFLLVSECFLCYLSVAHACTHSCLNGDRPR